MSKPKAAASPLSDNEHIQALLKILQENDRPQDAQNLTALLGNVAKMEAQLAVAVEELRHMRGELAAMREDHPLRNALQKAVITLQNQILKMREQLAALKENIIEGCKNAVAAFREKGVSALNRLTDFPKLRPALEAIGRNADAAILADDQAIAKIEAVSAEYHEAGRHMKNMFRAMAGKEAVTEAKASGSIAKTLEAPYKMERRALKGIRRGVDAALSGLSKLEQARPIREQYADAAKEVAAANAALEVPGRARAVNADRA